LSAAVLASGEPSARKEGARVPAGVKGGRRLEARACRAPAGAGRRPPSTGCGARGWPRGWRARGNCC